jgi:polygalacturonase
MKTPPPFTRRHFLGATSVAALGLLLPARLAQGATSTFGWDQSDRLLQRLTLPVFPARDFLVTAYGAAAGDSEDARPGMMAALQACHTAGGGRVIVPRGEWRLDGPLHLRSHVHLHLEAGAVLRFRTDDPALYLPLVLTRWEGTELFNYSPFIYAYQAVNVALTGAGMIDGESEKTFASWRERQGDDQKALRKMGGEGTPVSARVFGPGHWLRPSFVQFFGCTQVLVDGITLVDSPFWCLHAIACHSVTVRRVTVDSLRINNDGIDVESCSDVLIEDCVLKCGDDCIAIKSGRDRDGWRLGRPTENVLIRRIQMEAPRWGSGLALGSEMSGGVRQIWAEDLAMGYAKTALNIKGNLDRGGAVEQVRIRRTRVAKADTFIQFTTDYHGYRGGNHPPRFRDFVLEDLSCTTADTAIHAVGVPAAPLESVTLRRVAVAQAKTPLVMRHTQNFSLEDVSVNGAPLVVS